MGSKFVTTFLLIINIHIGVFGQFPRQRCLPVRTPMCKELDPKNYVSTSFPNFMNQTVYEQVNDELNQYLPLIESQCSPFIKMFLCSLYVPICKPGVGMRIPPCRSLCEKSREGCEILLSAAHIKWPESMNCDLFPKEEDHPLCISLPEQQHLKTSLPPPELNSIKKASVTIIIRKKQSGQSLIMQCPPNKKIFVRKIRFYHSSCCPPLAKSTISEMCNGKQYCKVKVEESIELAKCNKHVMYVTLKYKCVDRDADVGYNKTTRC